MANYRIFKIPIFSSLLLAGIWGSTLAPGQAASLSLNNGSVDTGCQESEVNNQSKQQDAEKVLPKPNVQKPVDTPASNAAAGEENPFPDESNFFLTSSNTSGTIAQLPPNAIAQGEACELVSGELCGVGGEVCDIAGPIPEGGVALAAPAFPFWALAPLAGLPFIGGGGGGTPPPPPNPIPEPSTILGSAVALGLVWKMNKKSKIRSSKNRSKSKTQAD